MERRIFSITIPAIFLVCLFSFHGNTEYTNKWIDSKIKLLPDGGWTERIEVDKTNFTLTVYANNIPIKQYPVAVGARKGDKEKHGDLRTPEGVFWVTGIENASAWTYDFKDGKGPITGAYGAYFFRLYTGRDATLSGKSWKGIGIHGTHDPSTIGTRSSHGCVRMKNKDLKELKQYIRKNKPVWIKH